MERGGRKQIQRGEENTKRRNIFGTEIVCEIQEQIGEAKVDYLGVPINEWIFFLILS